MKTTPTPVNRAGLPFIGEPHRPWKCNHVPVTRASAMREYSIRNVILAALQELNTFGPRAETKPHVLSPVPLATRDSRLATSSVNTRPGASAVFKLKGVRYLGSITPTQHMAMRIDRAWHQRQTMRTGRVCGQIFV